MDRIQVPKYQTLQNFHINYPFRSWVLLWMPSWSMRSEIMPVWGSSRYFPQRLLSKIFQSNHRISKNVLTTVLLSRRRTVVRWSVQEECPPERSPTTVSSELLWFTATSLASIREIMWKLFYSKCLSQVIKCHKNLKTQLPKKFYVTGKI